MRAVQPAIPGTVLRLLAHPDRMHPLVTYVLPATRARRTTVRADARFVRKARTARTHTPTAIRAQLVGRGTARPRLVPSALKCLFVPNVRMGTIRVTAMHPV